MTGGIPGRAALPGDEADCAGEAADALLFSGEPEHPIRVVRRQPIASARTLRGCDFIYKQL